MSKEQFQSLLTAEERHEFQAALNGADTVAVVTGEAVSESAAREEHTKEGGASLIGQALPLRLKRAMFGDKAERARLIMDASKLVQAAVLESPQIQDSEIDAFARNPNVSEFVLREIARNKEWVTLTGIRDALVWNPKSPVDLSLKLLPFINDRELKKLSKSRNVPNAVATTAKKRIADRAKLGR